MFSEAKSQSELQEQTAARGEAAAGETSGSFNAILPHRERERKIRKNGLGESSIKDVVPTTMCGRSSLLLHSLWALVQLTPCSITSLPAAQIAWNRHSSIRCERADLPSRPAWWYWWTCLVDLPSRPAWRTCLVDLVDLPGEPGGPA